MAPTTTSQRQPSDHPQPGRCTTCGLGFTAVNPQWTQCRRCYWAARKGYAPVDDRAGRAPAGRELPDGTFRAAAPNVPRMMRERNKAKGRAATLRLMALATGDAVAKRQLRARAYDLTHPGRLAGLRADWETRRLHTAQTRAVAQAAAEVPGTVA